MAQITIDNAESGREIPANQGDELTIRLDEIPTSGYRWVLEDHDPSVLRIDGDDYTPPPGDRLGGGGTRSFRFKVVGAGRSGLRLARRRPWDADSTAASFEVVIDSTH